ALYDSDQHRSNVFLYGYDSGVACLSFDSIVLWHLGYPDQALKMSDQACDLASKLSHPLNLAYAASFAAWFHSLIGSMQTAQEQADTGIAISDQYDIAMFLAWGKLMKGWALIGQGKIQEGIALASQGINEWRATGTLLATSWCLGILAQGNGKAGRTEESLALLAEALDFVSRTGEHFYEAELYRLRGELLLKLPAQHLPSEAEACFRLAIEIAQKQQAKSLELRARMSLARLCQRQSRTAEAHKMLAEVYSWFTEGFDTADLRDAKALLEELQQQSHKSVGFSLQAAELDTAEDRLKPELHAPSPSIAVLPFVNISTDPDNEYFCDGLAEEVLNALSKIEALRVVARTSSFSFKGKEIDIREIGQNLKVEAVLEGSVRKSGNRLRITAQLVNVADGYHLWSERYDRKMQDIFDIQDEISLAIVDALKVKLLGTEKAAVLKRYTDNMEAYQLYLKGRFHCSKWTAEGMKNAIELFEQAIVIEPDYAPAFAGLAACYVYLWLFNYLPPDESLPQMKAAAIRAMAIDPALAESHYAIARMKFWYEWKFQEAEREFKKGIELNPNYSEARERYGALLAAMDRYAEAVDEADRALDNDPLSFGTNYNVGWILCCAGQYDRMLEQGRKLIDLDASFYGGHILIGVESWANGEYDQAIAALLKAVSLGGGPLALSFLGCVYGIAGEQDKSRQLLEELQVLSARQYVLRCYFAMIYAGMGEMDRAFESLEQAYQQRDGILVLLKHIARFIPGLRGDPRLEDLLRRIGLPH
ncbi:MAG TPA: hypothetical protein VI837_02660, partial [Blastocatellia bacterium]|nr:hypothetical protein [Blastocatellia bacterium]